MANRRLSLPGLFAVLLALATQFGFGACVPAGTSLVHGASVICRTDAPPPAGPVAPKHHRTDCPLCPLCAADHAGQPAIVVAWVALDTPLPMPFPRAELPPPSIAPAFPHRPPSQPRAPPTFF